MYNISTPYQPYQLQHQKFSTQPTAPIVTQNGYRQNNDKSMGYGGGSTILRNGSNSYKPLQQNPNQQTNLANLTYQNNRSNSIDHYQQNTNMMKQPKFKPLKRTI